MTINLMFGCTTTPQTTVLTGDYDGGTIDTSLSSVTNENASAPSVELVPRNTSLASFGSYTFWGWAAKLTGVEGKTPTFSAVCVDTGISSFAFQSLPTSGYRPWFSYDQVTWTKFTNVSSTGSAGSPPFSIEFSHSSGFSQGTVYVRSMPGLPVSTMTTKVAALEGNALVSSTTSWDGVSSTGAAKFKIGATTSTTDEQSRTIPAQTLYGFKISSGGLATDGNAKRKVVLISGVHSAEQEGQLYLWAAIDYILSGVDGATALLGDFDFYCYPCVNPSGVYGGLMRADPHAKTVDPNRAWRTDINTVECANLMRPLISADVGGACTVFYDCHTGASADTMGYYYTTGQETIKDAWVTALGSWRTAQSLNETFSSFGVGVDTMAKDWAVAELGATFSVICELGLANTPDMAHIQKVGIVFIGALNDLFDGGHFTP